MIYVLFNISFAFLIFNVTITRDSTLLPSKKNLDREDIRYLYTSKRNQ